MVFGQMTWLLLSLAEAETEKAPDLVIRQKYHQQIQKHRDMCDHCLCIVGVFHKIRNHESKAPQQFWKYNV